jgi:hypothetical protein
MVWALAAQPETGSLSLTSLRVITILGMMSVEVELGGLLRQCLRRLRHGLWRLRRAGLVRDRKFRV